MNVHQIPKHFERIGAKVEIALFSESNRFSRRQRRIDDFSIDIIEEKNNERFLFNVPKQLEEELVFLPLDVQPKQRHLLLHVKNPLSQDTDLIKQKFLCGHDERHWFVAGVTGGVINVNTAMESLKPQTAVFSQRRNKVRRKNINKRKNAGFVRQGEWFFIPRPKFVVKETSLLSISKNEPLIRGGGGKPHIVEEVYRTGGEKVYVCRHYPNGLTEWSYNKMIKNRPAARSYNWRILRRNPRVYARGKVKHADHATITLHGWHQVQMNEEFSTRTVAFID